MTTRNPGTKASVCAPTGQPVRPPVLPDSASESIAETLFRIPVVHLVVYFDDVAPEDRVETTTTHAPTVLELLHQANMRRGTVVRLRLAGHEVAASAIARLNWFLHVHGYTRGFRGWKRAAQSGQGGNTFWRCAAAWSNLIEILNLDGKAAA